MTDAVQRELTSPERAAIQKLVKDLCANYDYKCGCMLLDGPCYMLGKLWTGAYCKYFTMAVLPTDPALEALLTSGAAVDSRQCRICGEAFPADGKQAYCSDACAGEAHRKQKRESIRKKRGGL